MQSTEKIWRNGSFTAWDDAQVHVLTHALHYGTGVFEGIRAYSTPDGTAVFRLTAHLERLRRSAALYEMELGFTTEELAAAVHETIASNGLDSCYIRPIVFRGYGEMGLYARNNPVDIAIAVWPWGAYLGEEALEQGVRCKISSYRRYGPNTLPPSAKASGQYINSVLAKHEASRGGYEEAILLNEQGYIADGSGENVFVVRDGVIHTPPISDSCLPGITRDSMIRIATRAGLRGARGQPRAHRPLLRGRGVPVRHGRRGDAGGVGRRPGLRRPRPGHRAPAARLLRRGRRPRGAVARVPRISGCGGRPLLRRSLWS